MTSDEIIAAFEASHCDARDTALRLGMTTRQFKFLAKQHGINVDDERKRHTERFWISPEMDYGTDDSIEKVDPMFR